MVDTAERGAPLPNIPSPDPSVRTVEYIHRELLALKGVLETRLDAMDRATILLNDNVTRVPTDTDKQIGHLKELHEERFQSVNKRFEERDARRSASEQADRTAVDKSLQAQKDAFAQQNASNAAAILKSEAATVKQLDNIIALLSSNNLALSDKIAVVNARLDRGEGANTKASSSLTTMISVIAVVISLMVGVVSVFNSTRSSVPSNAIPVYRVDPPLTVPKTP